MEYMHLEEDFLFSSTDKCPWVSQLEPQEALGAEDLPLMEVRAPLIVSRTWQIVLTTSGVEGSRIPKQPKQSDASQQPFQKVS